jgi:hypothetical protein
MLRYIDSVGVEIWKVSGMAIAAIKLVNSHGRETKCTVIKMKPLVTFFITQEENDCSTESLKYKQCYEICMLYCNQGT